MYLDSTLLGLAAMNGLNPLEALCALFVDGASGLRRLDGRAEAAWKTRVLGLDAVLYGPDW